MKKPILWLLSLLLILSHCACGSQPQSEDATTVPVEDGPFQVGFGRTLITPEGSLPMSASNSSGTRLSTQTLDDLYATCIAFTDGRGQTLLLFQMDLKYADGYADLARGQLSQELGIPVEVGNGVLPCGASSRWTPEK